MKTAIQSTAMALALIAGGPAVHAQHAAAASNLLGTRDQLVAAFDAMPEASLRDFFLHCSNEGSRRLMPLADAVACAIAWDTLLRREYSGDINALLAWWREHRDPSAHR